MSVTHLVGVVPQIHIQRNRKDKVEKHDTHRYRFLQEPEVEGLPVSGPHVEKGIR